MRSKLVVSALAAFAIRGCRAWANQVGHAHAVRGRRFHTRNVMLFVEQVGKATNGQLEIKVHSNGSLIKHPEMMRAVSTGQVNIAEFLLGQFANEEPVFAVDNLPFLAAGTTTRKALPRAEAVLERSCRRAACAALLGRLAGPGHLHEEPDEERRRPERHEVPHLQPADRALAELLGASPTVIQVPEVPQAFATGTISAMITSSATGTSTKAWEFVKNYYLTNAMHPKNVVVVNERAFQRLPAASRRRSSRPPRPPRRAAGRCRSRELEANELLQKNGMTLTSPTPR
jgi:TRAP-type C4-dicarboxylate transport system substrate-binding protein